MLDINDFLIKWKRLFTILQWNADMSCVSHCYGGGLWWIIFIIGTIDIKEVEKKNFSHLPLFEVLFSF